MAERYPPGTSARYDRRWAKYTARSLALLRPYLPAAPGRLLDVGCGTGALPRALAEWGVVPAGYVGVDPSPAMLATARRGGVTGLVRAAADDLPFRDGSFDCVVSASSLHEWPDPAAGLREARRVLAPGGGVLVVDWCADYASMRWMARWLRLTGRGVERVLSEMELRAEMERAGFLVTSVTRARITPLWGMMAAQGRLM